MSQQSGRPDAERLIDAALVHELLTLQHPDLAHLPICPAEAGWDNAMFRLGSDWMVRLPRRAIAAQLLEHEQQWLPQLAPRLTITVPVPYRIGVPTPNYPWKWSVVSWVDGVTADQTELNSDQARLFALFLRSLHQPAPANAPYNPYRSVSLQQRAQVVESRLHTLEHSTPFITPTIKQIWKNALQAEPNDNPCWIHGDLHPRNVLAHHEAIASIIDWGDLAVGDRATDLAAIWMLFSSQKARYQALETYNTTHAVLNRAKGWAIFFGTILLEAGLVNDPKHAVIGEKTLKRLSADG